MKLAFITHNYPLDRHERSNAGIFVYDLSANLASKGHSILVFVLNSDIQKTETAFDGKLIVHYIGKGSLKKSLGNIKIYNIFDILKIFNLFKTGSQFIISTLKSQSVDFCLAFWAIPSGIVASMIYKELKLPFAIWALGSDIYIYNRYPIIGSIISKAIKNSDLLFADGVNLCKIVEEVSSKKCIFLPSTTNFKNSYERNIHLSNKKLKFVFLGRMERVKGPDILLSSLAKLPKSSNFHAYFLGDGSLLSELKADSVKYGLGKNTTFLGNVNDKDLIYSYLKKCDFVIIPSRSDSIPLVIQESAIAGTPVVVSDVGDMKNIVNNYKIGYVFHRENVEELMLILNKLLKNGKDYKQIYKKNLKHFIKQFDMNKISNTLIREIKNKKDKL